MARPTLQGAPFSGTCSTCGSKIQFDKHHRARWRKGQTNFYCNNKCYSKSRKGKPNLQFQKLLIGNKFRVGKPPANKKYLINETYFQYITSPEKAYWLGYIAADGCVRKEDRRSTFYISSIDLDQLDGLKESLQSTHPIQERMVRGFKQYCFEVSSREFVNHLINVGIVPRKTFLLRYPWFLPKHLISHYIRGYFDGDGSVTTIEGRIQFNVVGTFDLIKGFAEHLRALDVLRSDGIYKDGNIFKLQRSQGQAISFLSYIYKESGGMRMDRKFNKFVSYKGKHKCRL